MLTAGGRLASTSRIVAVTAGQHGADREQAILRELLASRTPLRVGPRVWRVSRLRRWWSRRQGLFRDRIC